MVAPPKALFVPMEGTRDLDRRRTRAKSSRKSRSSGRRQPPCRRCPPPEAIATLEALPPLVAHIAVARLDEAEQSCSPAADASNTGNTWKRLRLGPDSTRGWLHPISHTKTDTANLIFPHQPRPYVRDLWPLVAPPQGLHINAIGSKRLRQFKETDGDLKIGHGMRYFISADLRIIHEVPMPKAQDARAGLVFALVEKPRDHRAPAGSVVLPGSGTHGFHRL